LTTATPADAIVDQPVGDVLVVGAGPTGLTAAISLMARGHQVTVVDRQAEGQNTSRAGVVYARTLEVLEPYGVTERLAAEGIHARRFTIRDRDRVLMTVPFDWLPTAYPYTLLVPQALTEAVLLQRLNQLGGRVLRPYALTSLDQDATGVTATFASGERMRASYVVGADGVHSTVREQASIGFGDGDAAGASYSLADVHLSGGLPADEVTVFFSPDGQLVSVPFPDGSYKLVANVAKAPPEPQVAFLQELVDARGPQAERTIIKDIVWASRFRIQHGVADRFHTGRIVLAGDAAHHNSPLGGQGMNAGIGDAVALGDALDAALERGATDALDSYAAARRSVARQVVAVTNRLTWLATMEGQVRTLRNGVLAMLGPFVSHRLAWRLSLLAYR
jgi:2-polyprenyl-6-methoxyphenol hydroxylase-like FAD-dependent oxidoreductase